MREALAFGEPIELFATAVAADRHPDLIAQAEAQGVRVDLIGDRTAASLSDTVTPQGLVAVCPLRDVELSVAFGRSPRLAVAVLDASDPGNAGTILRTADAAGADAMVFAGTGVDPFNGKLVRSTAGSLFHLDIVDGPSLEQTVQAARAAGMQVLAAAGEGDIELDDLAASGGLVAPTLWLMGNEAHGLPAEAMAAADRSVRIAIHGKAESLNLSVAAALCLYASARAHRTSADH